jgi:hypothetical protein
MAKKQTSKGPVKKDWVADPRDAIALAALRWYALTIDRLCIEIYATDRKKFEDLEDLLKSHVVALYKFGKGVKFTDEDECPEGYVMCNGLCAPTCNFE